MWDRLFDVSMLNAKDKIVISCPTEDLERELAYMLDDLCITYPNHAKVSSEFPWGVYKEIFFYFIDGNIVRFGSKSIAEKNSYNEYIKCSFFGEQPGEQSDPIDEDELAALLGVVQ